MGMIPSWLLLTKSNSEQFALGKEQITILIFYSQKTSDSLEKPMSKFPTMSTTYILTPPPQHGSPYHTVLKIQKFL